jgi:hypothetical protein
LGILSFFAHFDPEFKGVIENLEVGREREMFERHKNEVIATMLTPARNYFLSAS